MPSQRDQIQTDLAKEFARFSESERKILTAAVVVFAEKGFDGARTDEIAAQAGINKAMIYYYFKSKENLYTVIIEQVFSEVSQILGVHISHLDVSSPYEGISSFIDSYMDFIYTHRIFVKVLLWELARGGTIIARVVRSVLHDQTEQIMDLFQGAAREGKIRPMEPRHLVISMVGMTLFFFFAESVVRAVWGEDPMTPQIIRKRKSEITDLITYGILPKQG